MTKIELSKISLEDSWKKQLSPFLLSNKFLEIKQFIQQEKAAGKTIYPKGKEIFNAFELTPFDDVKVVILGQDPYHGMNQAHGLSFSVQDGIKFPPSLKNILKEQVEDVNITLPESGNLTKWGRQGVFLLNAMLTVEASKAGSHQKIGWQDFTDFVIKKLSDEREGIVFLLWGNFAKQKKVLIDTKKHHVLEAVHPSPFSCHKGFFGCKHFSKTNELLLKQNKTEINWQL